MAHFPVVVVFAGVVLAACGSSDQTRSGLGNPEAGIDSGHNTAGGGAAGTGGARASTGGAVGTGGARAATGGAVGAGGAGGGNGGGNGGALGTGGASVVDAGSDSSMGASPEASVDAGCSVTGLHFGADGDTVVVPSSTSMDFGAKGTLEVWLLADAGTDGGLPAAAGSIFDKWEISQEDKLLGVRANGGVEVYFFTSSGPLVDLIGPDAVTPSRWIHVAVAYDATSTRTYVDGTKVGEVLGASQAANAGGAVQIGSVTRDFSRSPVHGFYSDLRLSKVARYVANFAPAKHLTIDTDTIAFWKFNEGAGTAVTDSSGNGNAGTITGARWLPAACR